MGFDQERRIYRFQQGYGETLLQSIEVKDACTLICDGGVHPAWIIGHLAFVAHVSTKRLTGGEGAIDDEARWKTLFGGGSKAICEPSDYPAYDDIIAAWRAGHDALDAAVAQAPPDVLAQPNPAERMKTMLPTMGDLVSFVMTAHEGMHLGQLSTWRRVRGMPPLF